MPFIESEQIYYKDSFVLFFQFFVFVVIYTIPFEIRDLNYDSNELRTIPQIFGIEKSKYISYVFILIFISISLVNNTRRIDFISDILISFILFFIIYKTKKNQTKYFSSFWVESVPMYWVLIQLILFNRII
ncbi:hypothetical protein N8221_00560 [Flavobacteriaceae bacterium]|nr:hypothetical protein [Flavobacteriaceae bacterium]